LPGVENATVITMYDGFATWDRLKVYFPLFGVDHYFWQVNDVTPYAGRFFGDREVKQRASVCVLGKDLAKEVYGKLDNVVGTMLAINEDLYKVVGVLDAVSSKGLAKFAYIPVTTQLDRVVSLQPSRVYLRCSTLDDVARVAQAVPEAVRGSQSAEDLKVDVAWEQLKYIKRIIWFVELFVYVSIAATLVLGGFGIWSGMMAAVKARTREIGLKKAMGAQDVDIMSQFLAESLWLSLVAGVLGVLLARLGVEIAIRLLGSEAPTMLFLAYSCMAIVFSLLLGVGAGFYPSLRAARMEVVTALRYE